MSVANEVHTGAIPAAQPSRAAPKPVPLWMRPRFYRYGFLALILIVWELVGPLVNPIFFSYPSKIALAFYELTVVTGELQHYMVESLLILFYGLGFAILVGVPLAILMARFRPVDWLWFGIYMEAKVIVVFLFCVFPVLINTYQSVRECDKNMLEVARSFRSSEWRMWRDVLFPFALPYIAAGIRLAIGRGLVGVVIAEFYTTISGLGYMITRYAHIFDMDKTFVPIILLMFLGVSLTSMLKWVERRIAPWSHANR